jgi:hypothetical protein
LPPVLPPEEEELDDEELDEDEELDPPVLVEVEPPDVEVEPPEVEVEPPEVEDEVEPPEVVVETTTLPPLDPPPPPKKPPKKPPPKPPRPPPPITTGPPPPPPPVTSGCGGGGGTYCGTATIGTSGCSQQVVVLTIRRMRLVSRWGWARCTTRFTGLRGSCLTCLTLRYCVWAAGGSATWTAPPPTAAHPAAQADSFARAIRTDISVALFRVLLGKRG